MAEHGDSSRRLADRDGHRQRMSRDRGGRLMPRAQPRWQSGGSRLGHQVRSGTHHRSVTLHDERAVDQRELFHRLGQAWIENIAKILRVAVERIEN